MAVRTEAEFVREVLGKLGKLGNSQTPRAEDDQLIKARLRDVLDQLADDDLLTFDIADGIPGKQFIPIAYLTAVHLIDHFGSQNKAQAIFTGAQWADKTLRRQRQDGPYESRPAKPSYF